MQGIEIVRIGRKQLIVDLRGLIEPPVLLQRQRLLNGIGRRQSRAVASPVMLGSPRAPLGPATDMSLRWRTQRVVRHPASQLFLEHRSTWLTKGKGFSSTHGVNCAQSMELARKTARHRSMSIGSIGSSTSFWQQDQNFWQKSKQNDNTIAATTSVINAMASAETSLGKGLAGIANSSALNRTNSQLMAAIQNVLNGSTGQTTSSAGTSPAATTTAPVAATGTGTAALSTNTSLSLLGVLAGGKISVTAGMHTTTYTSTGTDTVGDLIKAINTNSFGSAQVTAALNSHGNLVLTSKNTTDVILVGGLYASNVGFGVGNQTFKPTTKTVPAPPTRAEDVSRRPAAMRRPQRAIRRRPPR